MNKSETYVTVYNYLIKAKEEKKKSKKATGGNSLRAKAERLQLALSTGQAGSLPIAGACVDVDLQF